MPDTATRDDVLDELHYLATVEHALLVDYLIIHCALGADVIADTSPATTAAEVAMNMAQDEMRHLRSVNQALVAAGRGPSLDRATHVLPSSGPPIPVGSFTPQQLTAFPGREKAVAREVDRRWERAGAAMTSLGDAAQDITSFLTPIPDHAARVAALVKPLAGLTPAEYVRASRILPRDELERTALALSDRYYQTIVATLTAAYPHDELSGLLGNSVSIMFSLQACMRELVTRGAVPSFALSPAT